MTKILIRFSLLVAVLIAASQTLRADGLPPVSAPDAGASVVLLAVGCAGIAMARRIAGKN